MIRRKHGALGTALIVGLGACSSGGDGGGGGAIEPGEWETTVELTSIDVSNLPPEMRRDMRLPADRTTTTRGCWAVTADRVRIENLRIIVPEPALRGTGCTFAELVLEGGALRGRMSCTGIPAPFRASGGAQTMAFSSELDGRYSPNRLQATARGEIRFGGYHGGGAVRITSRRLGQCPPPPVYVPRVVPQNMPDASDMNMAPPVLMAPAPLENPRGEALNNAATAR